MRLASFDIFDTTLIRLFGRPENINILLAGKEHSQGDTLERQVESDNLIANPAVRDIINKKRKEGCKIAFISDMYLDSKFLSEILKREGCMEDGDNIYVSCEHNARKDTGSLYDFVRKELQPDEWEHYGDNKQSDVIMAERKGIKTHHIDNAYRDLASRFVVPAYLPYVLWLLKEARQQNIQRLYFISRDGYILQQIAETLPHDEIELRYFFTSRKALQKALENKDEYQLTMQYFKQEGLMDNRKCAMVDVGWLGTSRKMINQILKAEGIVPIHFFYFGTTNSVLSEEYGSYQSYLAAGFLPYYMQLLVEHYFSASPYPTTLGYQHLNNDLVAPVYPNDEHYCESKIVKTNVEVNDTEELPSYKVSTIEESEINESEIVKNLLGDSARKIERELSIAEGDSEIVVQGINGLYRQYNSVSGDNLKLPEEVMTASTAPGWQDEEEYFIHTYEGMSDGVEYELFLGYDKKEKAEYVAYFPKNPGEVLGNPDLDYMTEYWMEPGLASVPDVKELIGEEPERNYDAILSEADSEIRTDLGLKTPEGFIQKDEYENSKEYIIFLSKSKLQQNGHESLRDLENIYDLKEVLENMGPNSYEFNGFEASYGASLANQDLFFDMSQGINGIHQGGIVYFTDEAILGYNLTIDKEFSDVISVISDNNTGMRELTEYIIKQGHTNIAYIHGELSDVTKSRIAVLKEVFKEKGIELPEERIIKSEYRNPTKAAKITNDLMKGDNPPTCIMYSDDYSAIGGMGALNDLNLRIPNDVSIAGFDDIFLASQLVPRLTTVRQNTEEIGRVAAEKLIKLIETGDDGSEGNNSILIPTELIEGESVKKIK